MIELKHLGKIYSSASGSVEALKDVNLTIADGEIFGIIGLSGAGKSTLVRCINLLERPTSGEVWVDGQNLTALSEKALLQVRRQIGMIFQSFNLLEQRSVLRNVCFPLEISGTPKAEAKKRAEELLKVVGLADKAASFPSQLSGGQKQRVAIVRPCAGDQSPVPAVRRGDQRPRSQHDALHSGAAARDQQDARRDDHCHHARDEGYRPDLRPRGRHR